MASTFMGLETAKRGISTHQAALLVTGHNISNANTIGYSRQRVNFATTNPFPTPGLDQPKMPGQLGTGVQANGIQRVRDSFTDMQYRTETSKLGYWQSKAEMLSQMEDIMNEPTNTGLAKTMDEFWNALQDMAVQPQNDGARRVVRERGITLANTFNYMSNSLKTVQKDFRKEIETTQDEVNLLLRQINAVNIDIAKVEPNGFLPNDLYDERDRLLDKLSSLVNIKVEYKSAGGLSTSMSEGIVDVYLATPNGDILSSNGKNIKLVDSITRTATGIQVEYDNASEFDSPVTGFKFYRLHETKSGFAEANASYELSDFAALNSNGALRGYIEGYGYMEGTDVKGTYNEMLADLDQMAYTFATHFNAVHDAGWSLREIQDGAQSATGHFFDFNGVAPTAGNVKGAAANLKIHNDILSDIQNIAAAAEGNVLAGIMNRVGVPSGTTGNPFYTGVYAPTTTGWPTEGEIELSVKFDDATDAWKYEFKDKSGTVIGNGNLPTDGIIHGITVDVSKIKFPTAGGDAEWTMKFKAEGRKSSDVSFSGDGSNALALANVKDAILDFGGNLTNVQSYFQGMIGELGVAASEANRMTDTSTVLRGTVEDRRLSVSAVSLDEEMTNMIQFQHAYNAAARQITAIDEMLDKIINGMGLVGR